MSLVYIFSQLVHHCVASIYNGQRDGGGEVILHCSSLFWKGGGSDVSNVWVQGLKGHGPILVGIS